MPPGNHRLLPEDMRTAGAATAIVDVLLMIGRRGSDKESLTNDVERDIG
jgi:hypothetical protein